VRILVAPDCFTGTLSAAQAAAAMAEGWQRHAPGDQLELCPLSDGGPGFLEVLHAALGGRPLAVTVRGPLGEPAPAGVLLVPGPDGGTVAYLESAQACGLHLVPPDRRDPGRTTTAGVGALLLAARAAGARTIVVGLGGSATNDAGAGLLAALRADPELPALTDDAHAALDHRLARGGAALAGVAPAELGSLADLPGRWAGVELVIASDVDSPLLGFHGASAGYAEQKGASPERAQALERCVGDFAAAVGSATGVLTGTSAGLATCPGAGAAGGLGFALLLLGARRVGGAQAVLDAVGFGGRVGRNDLVVTGEGSFDWQSLRGKVVTGVARSAMQVGTPVVVVAGQVLVGRREALAVGVESAYPVARTTAELDAALADPAGTLAARVARVARTWSR
jgi:glycerate 2-kinase